MPATCGAKRRHAHLHDRQEVRKERDEAEPGAQGSSAASGRRVRSAGMKLTVATGVSGSRPPTLGPEMGEGQHEVGIGDGAADGRRSFESLQQLVGSIQDALARGAPGAPGA